MHPRYLYCGTAMPSPFMDILMFGISFLVKTVNGHSGYFNVNGTVEIDSVNDLSTYRLNNIGDKIQP